MPLAKLPEATALVKAHLAREAEAGFPRLSRIPSSSIIKFLDYFATLAEVERQALLDAMAMGGALHFFPPHAAYDAIHQLRADDAAMQRYRTAMMSPQYAMGMRHQSLRTIKVALTDPMSIAMMAQTRARLDFIPRDDLPPELVPDPDLANLKPARAPQLRKLIDGAFQASFHTTKEKRFGGEILYNGICGDVPVTIGILFVNRGVQLIYHINIPDESRTILLLRFAYEHLWSAGGGWDYLTEENAEAAIALLCDLVGETVRLRNSMYALLRQA